MLPRSVSIFLGTVFLLAWTWHVTPAPGSQKRLFLLPMTGDLAWRPATRAWTIAPVAQLAPAPVKKPGIARPGIAKPQRERRGPPPQKQKQAQKVKLTKKTDPITEEIPPYKVVLLGDDEYEEEHVVISLRSIIPELKMEPRRASEIFELAQKHGRELVVIVQQDLAELYAQQLTRCVPIVYAVAEKA